MNIENFQFLLAHLRGLKKAGKSRKFDMRRWLKHREVKGSFCRIRELKAELALLDIDEPVSATECGTAGCIAGHAALIGGAPDEVYIADWAAGWLGLNVLERIHLFGGDWSDKGTRASLTAAIRELERIIETGEVIPGEKSGR